MKTALLVSLTLFTFTARAEDPVGQIAHYKIDTDPKRTSSFIESGNLVATVTKFVEEAVEGPAYEVALDYIFDAGFFGKHEGTEVELVDREYFTPEFLTNLRKTGHYEGKRFKADHKGYADATTLAGLFYPQCDIILLYDMEDKSGTITDLKVLAHVKEGIPVLGAVKIDMSGVYQGMNIKVGGDYELGE